MILLQADVLVGTGKLAEAAALLEQAVRHDRREADLWVAWVASLARQEKISDAFRVLEQAAAPDAAGDTANLRIVRARLLNQRGNGDQACETLIRGEEKLPATDRPLIWGEYGTLMRQRHEDAEARKAFLRYAELLPDDPRPSCSCWTWPSPSATERPPRRPSRP